MRFAPTIRIHRRLFDGLSCTAIAVASVFAALPAANAQLNTELLVTSSSAVGPVVTINSDGDISVAEQYLFDAANQERAAAGLPALQLDASLSQASALHAAQMAAYDDISHQFPGEPDLEDRGENAGIHFSLIAENVGEAPTSVIIHNLWMKSPDHRANLLDPDVNTIGIAVVQRDGELYAVEDFADTIQTLTYDQQETAVSKVLSKAGVTVGDTSAMARITCAMPSGYVGLRKPSYIVRYTASTLTDLPTALKARLSSGEYHQAVVGACADSRKTAFTAYNIAVLLYP